MIYAFIISVATYCNGTIYFLGVNESGLIND